MFQMFLSILPSSNTYTCQNITVGMNSFLSFLSHLCDIVHSNEMSVEKRHFVFANDDAHDYIWLSCHVVYVTVVIVISFKGKMISSGKLYNHMEVMSSALKYLNVSVAHAD